MANLPKADRRGNTVLVPIGIAIVFVILAALMLLRNNPGDRAPPRGEMKSPQASGPLEKSQPPGG
jgi:hypothetical protein